MQPTDSARERRKTLGVRLLPGLAVLAGFACSPTEILEEQFQSRQQTCYEFPESADGGPAVQASFWNNTYRREGCDEEQPIAVPATGTGSMAAEAPASQGAVVPAHSAPTTSDPAPAPDAGAMLPSDAGTTALPVPTQGTGPLPAGCQEEDILARFARPSSMGGCTDPDGLGCHEDGTGEAPFMAHPTETLARLLDQQDADGCGEVWIPRGAKRPDDSFLYRRLTQNVSDEDCEVQMPLDEEPLDPATLQCIGA
ncbi:MAG TPA: hypothetical protein VJU61_04600, partial [Polyangiaceae bacterium]|nr:hypothetical protein [Polyangiaceae bacterium]